MEIKLVGLLSSEDNFDELALIAKVVILERRMKLIAPSDLYLSPGRDVPKEPVYHQACPRTSAVFTVRGLT